MEITTIDWRNFLAGESTADTVPDKGFSPDSYGLNLTKTRGLLYFTEASTDRGSTTLTGNIIASAEDQNAGGNDKYFLDDEGAFYTYSSSNTFTKRQTGTDAFTLGTSDLIQFNLNTYASSETSLYQLTGSDLATIERLWGGAFTSSNRHPLEIVEDEMFVADGNVIYFLNNSGSTGTAFTLPVQSKVTSLRRHPNGRTLLAFCGLTNNYSHTKPQAGKVYYCNPLIRDWEREVTLDAQVEGTRVVSGVIHCTWGNTFGYFNGDGLMFMKRLATSTTTYSQNITNMEDILMVRDGLNVLAYGDLGAGKVWWKPYRNDVNSLNINTLCFRGDNKLLIAFSDGATAGKLVEVDFDNAGIAGKFYGNKMIFPTQSTVRRMEILHETKTGTNYFTISNRDETDTEQQFFISNPSIASATWDKYRTELDYKADQFQLVVTPSSGGTQHGYRFFRLYHEPIER